MSISQNCYPNLPREPKHLPGIFSCITFEHLFQISSNWVTSSEIYLGLVFWGFFIKLKLAFAVSALFHAQIIFLGISSVEIMNIYILDNLRRI